MLIHKVNASGKGAKINLEDINKIFTEKGIKLLEEVKNTNHFVLNGMKAITYKLENGETISFYVFGSEKKREEGLEDFNKQKAKYDMQIPSIYEVENVLILYWYNGETGSITQYDNNIKEAFVSLSVL